MTKTQSISTFNEIVRIQDDTFRHDFETVLRERGKNASRFLEYGPGITTLYISIFIQEHVSQDRAIFLSMDHDSAFIDFICHQLERHPFEYWLAKDLASRTPVRSGLYDGSFPVLLEESFDFVCVDCRRYPSCIGRAAELVAMGGTLVLHGLKHITTDETALFHDVARTGSLLVLSLPKACRKKRVACVSADRRAIVVPFQGALAAAHWKIARPWAQAYARRLGAELRAINVPPAIPPAFVKFFAARKVRKFDRMILMDADIIIRPHAPDLFRFVPKGRLGVMPEGRVFPRQHWMDETTAFYGSSCGHTYFNSGVMVLDRDILDKLFAGDQDVLAFPKYEQNFLNWQAARLHIPLFELPLEFNYIAGQDWRRSFFYHFAGTGMRRFQHDRLWSAQGTFEKSKAWQCSRPSPSNYKYFAMRIADSQMRGRRVTGIDSDELHYTRGSGIAALSDGQAYAFLRKGNGLAACTRKITLTHGRYSIRFVTSPVAMKAGTKKVRIELMRVGKRSVALQSFRLTVKHPGRATLPDIRIDEPSEELQLRLHRCRERHLFVLGIELERHSPA